MYNELFSIGPFTIYGYGLMIGIGVLSALVVADKRAKKKGLDPNVIYSLGFYAIAFGFVGAKLLYCLLEFREFIENPWSALTGSGFVVFGGVLGGILTAFIYCRIRKLHFFHYFDLCIPSVALAQGLGRIGCFLAGCCYGRETDSFIGIVFHHSAIAPNDVKLLPTQLWSSAGDFLLAFILIWYARRKRQDGKVGGLYFILYSIGRFVIEFFRNDFRGSIGFLSTSQFISIITLLIGIFLFFAKKPMPDSTKNESETHIPDEAE